VDYTSQKLTFRIRKALRYTRLYGPRRTVAKVRAQYHMRRRLEPLPAIATPPPSGGHVALVGCGNFAFSTIAYYLKREFGAVMRASMDTDVHHAASLCGAYGLRYYTDDARRIVDDPAIDLLYVASNHASHAEYAIDALERGKHVHIEKPHVVSDDQLVRLCRAMRASTARVALGFNRPTSRLGALLSERLGAQSGPAMLNWFVAGHELPPDHWYFRPEEGGRVLGNLCHWTDFVLRLVPREVRYPITIRPTRWERSDCDIAVTYVFGDGTIAAITFSAKGHTFEGVRELFAAHRGDVLIALRDFQELVVETVARKEHVRLAFRDHGHRGRVVASYGLARPDRATPGAADVAYVWETGELFLRTREALEQDRIVVVRPYDPSRLETRPRDVGASSVGA
jgi:predicted dehydrogenase